jgi:asparagine synthase (glutamine-hydrolysing)
VTDAVCGIVGIFGREGGHRDRDIARMLAAVRSRGEVDEVRIGDRWSVATRRLRIVDRERAVQPMFGEDGQRFIIFNGEIFNHKALRQELEASHTFATESDTETILHAYEEFGERCVERLDGQFAFVIHDIRDGTVFGARDPFGVVPLYLATDGGTLYVASTVGALTDLGRPIRAVPPGHTLDRNGHVTPYARPEPRATETPAADGPERLKAALGAAVAKRVDTDLPVAVLYSGGIDSSIVLHEASRRHGDVTAFTIGTPDSEDLAISRRFCAERGIPQVIVPIARGDVTPRTIRRTIAATELAESLDVINAVVSMPLFRRIHEAGIKVALGGDGGDELFGGYPMYQRVSVEDEAKLFRHKLMSLHRTELQRVDRCSMAFEVETRVPFLDPVVVGIALDTPRDDKVRDGVEKWILREAYRDDLPDYILERPKNPLSHSSGVHEWARMYKILFRRYYDQQRFDLHEPMRMDFSHVLAMSGYDVDRAIEAERTSGDYPRLELVKESVKAGLRSFLLGSKVSRARSSARAKPA